MTPEDLARAALIELVERPGHVDAVAGGVVVGTAIRSRHPDEEWCGWLVSVNGEHEVLPTKPAATAALIAKAEWLLELRASGGQ